MFCLVATVQIHLGVGFVTNGPRVVSGIASILLVDYVFQSGKNNGVSDL